VMRCPRRDQVVCHVILSLYHAGPGRQIAFDVWRPRKDMQVPSGTSHVVLPRRPIAVVQGLWPWRQVLALLLGALLIFTTDAIVTRSFTYASEKESHSRTSQRRQLMIRDSSLLIAKCVQHRASLSMATRFWEFAMPFAASRHSSACFPDCPSHYV
jgi:hypothetical protein